MSEEGVPSQEPEAEAPPAPAPKKRTKAPAPKPEITVLIPYRAGGDEWREKAWAYVSNWWAKQFPTFEVIICSPGDGPWSKGAALANGAEIAQGRTLVIADADSFVYEPATLATEIGLVHDRHQRWSMPHRYVHRVTQEATASIYETGVVNVNNVAYPVYGGCEGGGIVILRRDAWDAVGGIDPRFEGWGGEDKAFGWMLRDLIGAPHRGNCRLVHLWHTVQGPRRSLSRPTMTLLSQYQRARRNAPKLRALAARESP